MNKEEKFKHIACGQTLPPNNVHAVSVSIPTFDEVIRYEEGDEEILAKIKSGYPRFVLHPYLKLLTNFIKEKYSISNSYEVVLLSSKKAVDIVIDTFYIHNKIDIDEPFGVILVLNETSQLQKVLSFIQHVGCNLSSRFAQDYLIQNGVELESSYEEIHKKKNPEDFIISSLSKSYEQPKSNICITTTGMNAIYSILKGIESIQKRNSRDILIQFGWLYLDTMNIVQHYFKRTKTFYDVKKIDLLEEYLENNGFKVSAIITEVPTNPTLKCADLVRMKRLCLKYDIPLIIDSTMGTSYNLDLKPYGDIFVESLTKFASGNADVMMGCFILNENSKFSNILNEFKKHTEKPYIRDCQRLAYEIQDYEKRVKKISSNSLKLVEYLKTCSYVDELFYSLQKCSKKEYENLMRDENSCAGVISMTFKKPFKDVYDILNFAKGPSLGTEFTLLMPYVYLAHYDYIIKKSGREFLEQNSIPVDLLRVSVGCEDIEDIISEFKKIEEIKD